MINPTHKNELIKLTILIGIVCLISISWLMFQNGLIFNTILNYLESFTGQIVNLVSSDLTFKNSTLFLNEIPLNKKLVFPHLTIPLIFSLIPLLYIYVPKLVLNFIVLSSTIIYFIVRSAFVTILFYSEASKEFNVLLSILDTIRYLPFYLIALYIILNNEFLKSYYLNLKRKFDEVLQFDINVVIILLIFNSIPRIFITFAYPEILDSITVVILNLSHFTINLFGVDTYVNYKTIYLAENWIYLGHGCLGLGLLTMVIVLISATKSRLINKLTFIFLLLPVQLVFNSLRIDLLVIYYYNNWDLTIKPTDMHDYSNVFIYSLGFGMFLMYYFWYQDVKFIVKMKGINLK